MRRHRLADPGGGNRGMEEAGELAGRQWPARLAAGKEPAPGHRRIGIVADRALPPPLPQQAQDIRRQHHVAVLAPLALDDADDVLGAVDVAGPEADHFAGPQAAAIGQRHNGPHLDARRHRQQTLRWPRWVCGCRLPAVMSSIMR
jgi:hypothetical protein